MISSFSFSVKSGLIFLLLISNFSFFDIVVMLSSDSGTFAATNAGSVVARCGRSSYGDEGGDVKMRGRNTFRCSFSELVSQCV